MPPVIPPYDPSKDPYYTIDTNVPNERIEKSRPNSLNTS